MKSIYAISFAPIPRRDSRQRAFGAPSCRFGGHFVRLSFACLRAQPNLLQPPTSKFQVTLRI